MLTRRAKIFIIFIKKRKEEEKTSWRQWLGEVERLFEFISQTQWCSDLFLSKSLAKHSESFFLLQRKPKVRKRLWGGKPSFHCGRPTFTGANIQRGENGRKYGKPASNTARKARAQRCVKKVWIALILDDWRVWRLSDILFVHSMRCFWFQFSFYFTTRTKNTEPQPEENIGSFFPDGTEYRLSSVFHCNWGRHRKMFQSGF